MSDAQAAAPTATSFRVHTVDGIGPGPLRLLMALIFYSLPEVASVAICGSAPLWVHLYRQPTASEAAHIVREIEGFDGVQAVDVPICKDGDCAPMALDPQPAQDWRNPEAYFAGPDARKALVTGAIHGMRKAQTLTELHAVYDGQIVPSFDDLPDRARWTLCHVFEQRKMEIARNPPRD